MRLLDRYEHRRNLLRDGCRRYGLPLGRQDLESRPEESLSYQQKQWRDYNRGRYGRYFPMMYNRERALAYVWTRKVASTSWSILFYNLAGKSVVSPDISIYMYVALA